MAAGCPKRGMSGRLTDRVGRRWGGGGDETLAGKNVRRRDLELIRIRQRLDKSRPE